MSARDRLRVVGDLAWMTPGQHLTEARRLLLKLDELVQGPDVTVTDLALAAMAHAVVGAAGDAR